MSIAGSASQEDAAPFWSRRGIRLIPGLGLVVVVAAVATWLGSLVPIIGAPVFGILIGAGLATVIPAGAVTDPGARFAGKRVLQGSVILLGTGLSLTQVARVGVASLPVMLGTLAVALLGAWSVGRLLKVDGDIRTLVGVGTGICGASAIAATTAVIGATDAEVAYAIGTIFTFNIAAVLLFPAIGHLLGLSQHAFGLWAGTAINDTSSVVAAAYTYGQAAGAYAVVVKLTRTLMIIPISIVLAVVTARRIQRASVVVGPAEAAIEPSNGDPGSHDVHQAVPRTPFPWKRVVPLFVVGFLAASALDTLGLIPAGWHPTLSVVSLFMITMALTGIGLGTRISTIRSAGVRPLLLGGILWVLVAVASLLLQWMTGTL